MGYYQVKLQRSDALPLPAHPRAYKEGSFAEWCRTRTESGERLAIDLFSGAGGLSLGLEQAGWTVVVSVDHDPRALETHRANFPGLALDLDLGDPTKRAELKDLLRDIEIDLVAGGPPCQPFSRAGRSKIRSLVDSGAREAHDQRKELWQAYLDVVLSVRPRAVLMENVPDMALGDGFAVVRTIVDELEHAGYYTQVRLVDAWKYGVPQHRKRLIVLARLDADDFPWPDEQSVVTLKDAIRDLPPLKADPGGAPLGDRQMQLPVGEELSEFARLMRGEPEGGVLWDHMTRSVRKDDLEVFKMMTSKTLYSDIPKEHRRYKADTFDDKYKRLAWDQASRSITAHIAKDGYWYIHPEEHRTLTVREAARIQTFPDHYRFAGTRSDAFRQIGNAVPPLLGQAAATVLHPVDAKTPRESPSPSRWLAARDQLSAWAAEQRTGRFWFAFPGRDMTPAIAIVVTLLSTGKAQPASIGNVLSPFRAKAKMKSADLDKIIADLGETKSAKSLDRLRPHTRAHKIWGDQNLLAKTLTLLPAESQLFRLLLGEDIMLTSQTSLRVAARVAGNGTDKTNRLTDGRIDLARLIGSGQDAPLRMTALRLIGTTNCLSRDPFCDGCPLAKWCTFAADRPGSSTLF